VRVGGWVSGCQGHSLRQQKQTHMRTLHQPQAEAMAGEGPAPRERVCWTLPTWPEDDSFYQSLDPLISIAYQFALVGSDKQEGDIQEESHVQLLKCAQIYASRVLTVQDHIKGLMALQEDTASVNDVLREVEILFKVVYADIEEREYIEWGRTVSASAHEQGIEDGEIEKKSAEFVRGFLKDVHGKSQCFKKQEGHMTYRTVSVDGFPVVEVKHGLNAGQVGGEVKASLPVPKVLNDHLGGGATFGAKGGANIGVNGAHVYGSANVAGREISIVNWSVGSSGGSSF
jgi:hypothetical protein